VAIRGNIHKHIAEVVLDCPPVNALDGAAWNELARLVAQLGVKSEVRCLLLRAEGRGFCAGVDGRELQRQPQALVELNHASFLALRAIRACEVPVVTAVHSFVIGGGVGICGAADVVLAAEDAYFVLPGIDHGAMSGAAHIARLFPLHRARAAFFTGGRITAAEAYRLGAVERLVPGKKLLKEARAFAGLIAAKDRRALMLAKEALNGLEGRDLERGYRIEQGFALEMFLEGPARRARAAQDRPRTPGPKRA
jgi:enoyl-CoA hydratase